MTSYSQTVFFTIVARNYLAHARVLMDSLAEHHSANPRWVIICDGPVEETYGIPATLVHACDLGIEDFAAIAFRYSVLEFATAMKPFGFLHLLKTYPGQPIVYLDPDILVTAPLIHVEAAFAAGASLILTPHITVPLQDGYQPDDHTILKAGIYNLGFAGVAATDDGQRLVNWWSDRCRRDALIDIPNHMFTDQRWMDLAPSFVATACILREPGYNLAFWNLSHRRVTRNDGMVFVEKTPLRFVHFSGSDPSNREIFSKNQNRFRPDDLGDLRPLFDRYLDLVIDAGWAKCANVPYHYSTFDSGRVIHPAMRYAYRQNEDLYPTNPFLGSGNLFDRADVGVGAPRVTRIMFALWQSRPSLKYNFDLETSGGRSSYLRWFGNDGARQSGFDETSLASIQDATTDWNQSS